MGWSELELFGIYNGDLKFAVVRTDAQGLITVIGLSTSHTYTIIGTEPEWAVVQTNGGAILRHRRRLGEKRWLFWEHSAFRAGRTPLPGRSIGARLESCCRPTMYR